MGVNSLASSISSFVMRPRARRVLSREVGGFPDGCFVILNAPGHGNLGDQAILEGEIAFLSHYFPSHSVMKVMDFDWRRSGGIDLSSCLSAETIVLFHGGGFLGTLWPIAEECLVQAVDSLGGRPAVVMPQTCWYSNDREGRDLLAQRQAFYTAHPEVSLMLRDRRSYEFCIREFPINHPELVPDMVMFLEPHLPPRRRKGALLCLRGDLERVLDDGTEAAIEETCRSLGLNPRRTDTVVDVRRVTDVNRRSLLDAKLTEFASAELVVTDRLHGMVMAAITRTPVVALDNISRKVSGVGEWVSSLPYVRLVQPGDDIAATAREAMATDPTSCPSTRELLSAHYDRLASLLSERLGL